MNRIAIHKSSILTASLLLQGLIVPAIAVADEATGSGTSGIVRLAPDNLFAVEFADEQHGIVAGESGRVLRTSDGGDSWNLSYIGQPELIRRVSYGDALNVWAVGHRGSIFYSADGGESWAQQYQEEGVYLRDVSFFDAQNGWAVGHGATILNTRDGGQSWKKQQITGYSGRDLPRLHGIVALSPNKAVAVGEFGVIVHTESGGALWVVTPVDQENTWTAVDGLEASLLVIGLDGNAAEMSIATDEERQAIKETVRLQAEKEEAKRKRKAELRKREYVPREIDVQLQDVEYVLSSIDTGTTEHLFDVDYRDSGISVIAGRGLILGYGDNTTVRLESKQNLPVQFMWFGGIASTSPDGFLAVGIRGAVVEGSTALNEYQPKLAVAGRIPDNIVVKSTNWTNNSDR